MTVLVCYHLGTYRTFKEYYLVCIRGQLRQEFPDAVSYNRFVELMPRVFLKIMMFMKLYSFGKCTSILFIDSTMIPVCHNLRHYFNKVVKGIAKDGKGIMGWCHGFKLHLLCNDSEEVKQERTPMTTTSAYGACSPGNSMEKSSPAGDISRKNSSAGSSNRASISRMALGPT